MSAAVGAAHTLCRPRRQGGATRPADLRAPLHRNAGGAARCGDRDARQPHQPFGLADVRGAVHAGFDEGAWITTAVTVGQMMIGPASPWLGAVFGVRRVLMISATIFGISNLLLPFSPDLASCWRSSSSAGSPPAHSSR